MNAKWAAPGGASPAAWAYSPSSYASPPPGTSQGGYGQARSQHPLDRVLSQHAWIALDEKALDRFYQADTDRAIEIIQDIVAKGDVRNPSAFVCQALRAHPEKRGNPADDLQQALARRPGVANALDSKALQKLQGVDPRRAVEIIEDVAAAGHEIRNVSAFVAKALSSHPQKRGSEESFGSTHSLPPLANPKRPRTGASYEERRASYSSQQRASADPGAALDDAARRRLDEADPERAAEILQELADKGSEIRNASAFLSRALQSHPQVRGRRQ